MGKKYLEAFKNQKNITYSQVGMLACTYVMPEPLSKNVHNTIDS